MTKELKEKNKNPKIITRVDDAFYNRCVEKLNNAISDTVFNGDTELDKILLKDIFIVLGYYVGWIGRALCKQFNPELLEDEDVFTRKILAAIIDLEELWQGYEFSEMLTALGGFIEIAGKELPAEAEVNKEVNEEKKEGTKNESG